MLGPDPKCSPLFTNRAYLSLRLGCFFGLFVAFLHLFIAYWNAVLSFSTPQSWNLFYVRLLNCIAFPYNHNLIVYLLIRIWTPTS